MQDSDIQIDPLALDKECIRQPQLILQASHAAAEARLAYDKAKNKMEVLRCLLMSDIRKSPEDYDLVKVTETALVEALNQHPRYQTAQENLLDLKTEVVKWDSRVIALEHKKRSLELLVKLHGTGYFGDPRMSPEDKEAVETKLQGEVRTKRRMAR